MTKDAKKAELVGMIDALQVWFAGHKSSNAGWADRERLEADLIEKLRMVEESK
jgi:hypothetical protein